MTAMARTVLGGEKSSHKLSAQEQRSFIEFDPNALQEQLLSVIDTFIEYVSISDLCKNFIGLYK